MLVSLKLVIGPVSFIFLKKDLPDLQYLIPRLFVSKLFIDFFKKTALFAIYLKF